METALKGLASLVIVSIIFVFLVLASVAAITNRIARWDESQNQVQIAQFSAQQMEEQTEQVKVVQENETTRYLAYLKASVQALEIQEQGLTNRTELEQDTLYNTSWTSLVHRTLTPLLTVLWTAIVIVWILVLVKLFRRG